MLYLNLTEGFNPMQASEDDCIKFESFFFNGGEPHIKLKNRFASGPIVVSSLLRDANEFMMLMVATEALSQSGMCTDGRMLFIPYFPGARQDRRMINGEPLTAKVYAEMINSLEYDNVTIFDPHSDVTPALLTNCDVISNHDFAYVAMEDIVQLEDEVPFLVSPDAGANKKVFKLAQHLNKDVVKCDKKRSVIDGSLSGFEVYTDDLKGRPCVIVDDICDGGGTFVGLAEELKRKNAGNLYLVVSHGIFSKPLKELEAHFKYIYTTDSWRSDFSWERKERENTKFVRIIKLENLPLC